MNEALFQIAFEHWTFDDLGLLSQICRGWRDLLDSNRLEFWRRKWAQLYLGPAPRFEDPSSFKRLCFYRNRFDEKGRLVRCVHEDERALVHRLIEQKEAFLRRLEEDRWALVRRRTHQGRDVCFFSHIDDRSDPTRSVFHLRVVFFIELDGKVVPLKVEFNHDRQLLRGEQEERAVFGCNYTGEVFACYDPGDDPASEFYLKRMARLNGFLLGEEGKGFPHRWLVELLGLDRFVTLLNRHFREEDEFARDLEPICEKDDPEWEDSWTLPIERNMFSLASYSEEDETDEEEMEDETEEEERW